MRNCGDDPWDCCLNITRTAEIFYRILTSPCSNCGWRWYSYEFPHNILGVKIICLILPMCGITVIHYYWWTSKHRQKQLLRWISVTLKLSKSKKRDMSVLYLLFVSGSWNDHLFIYFQKYYFWRYIWLISGLILCTEDCWEYWSWDKAMGCWERRKYACIIVFITKCGYSIVVIPFVYYLRLIGHVTVFLLSLLRV